MLCLPCEDDEDEELELPPRWKRSIQDEAEGGVWRDASSEERVEEDQRERKVLSLFACTAASELEGGVMGGVTKEFEYIPTSGLSGTVGSVDTDIELAIVGVSTSKSKEDKGESGNPLVPTCEACEYTLMLSGVLGTALSE